MGQEATSWIDIHCHLAMLKSPVAEVFQRAEAAGVRKLINVGTEPSDWDAVSQVAQEWFPKVACTIGVHPHSASLYDQALEADLRKRLQQPWVAALGEIGLDYYYTHSQPAQQRVAFRRQLEVACELQLPIQVHTRDAEPDTLAILESFRGRLSGGVIHCFTGSWELAYGALDLGLDISVSGIVTFKTAEALREVIRKVPLNRLHLETDAPFLAPVPKRGMVNESAFLPYTAQYLARLKDVAEEELARQMWSNSLGVFSRLSG